MSKSSILGPQLAVWKPKEPKKLHNKHPAMPYTPKKSETPQVGKLVKKSDCTDSMGKKRPQYRVTGYGNVRMLKRQPKKK